MTTIDAVRQRAEADARTYGYYLNPDPQFLQSLLEGLKQNEERYSYPSCPCRLSSGKFEIDRDVICPCDYRDLDVQQYGACYCGLYVRKDVYEGKTVLQPVPERRPVEKQAKAYSAPAATKTEAQAVPEAKKKLWYCKQCGYVVYRDEPPYVCPICKAKRELFGEINTRIDFSG
ncbi:MAG: ferredoxin:glutaredoxin reductase [Candidatus Bathyarchaeota archaeon]|nr:ferredoxin:glutaredoxin reductase [Candidatus Bathyarchaeota archaeon]